MSEEIELRNPPNDTISSVRFSGSEKNVLLSTAWDNTVRLHDTEKNNLLYKMDTGSPLLDGRFDSNNKEIVYVGGVSTKLHILNIGSEKEIGSMENHKEPIKSICHCKTNSLVMSGSWDKSVVFVDCRSNELVYNASQPDRVYSMDISYCGGYPKLVVGMANRHINIYDLRNLERPLQRRESSMKYQTRCVRCSPVDAIFACSSIEGTVALEYLDQNPSVQNMKYAFRCHRGTDANGTEIVYPVNALAFHPTYGTFLTGGSDGIVNSWDGSSRRRIRSFPRYPTSVSCLDYSVDGTVLAVASSYCYEEGQKDHPLDAIYIKPVLDTEVKPKKVAKKD